MKLCKDCKWSTRFELCAHDKLVGKPDPFSGKKRCYPCYTMRQANIGWCGTEAKYFEPKETFKQRIYRWVGAI
jgi:hypothetical protein